MLILCSVILLSLSVHLKHQLIPKFTSQSWRHAELFRFNNYMCGKQYLMAGDLCQQEHGIKGNNFNISCLAIYVAL